MVVFTCNHCGESLQKPRVEKHFNFTCRTEKFLTCVDCFKDFRGDDYNIHTKCVSEEQRYSGKDYVEKTKKGEVKQESWMEMIKSIIMHEPSLRSHYKSLLNTISHYNNVPRKKIKFVNFIKSSTGGRVNSSDIEGVWDIIEKYKSQNAPLNENDSNCKNEIKDNSIEVTHNTEVDVQPLKKKKKTKDGVKETDIIVAENISSENTIEDGKLKKNKKKHKAKSEDNTNDTAEMSVKEDNSNCEEGEKDKLVETTNDVQLDVVPPKKKKKVKNGVEETDIIEAENISSENTIEDGKLKKNKKKHNANSEDNTNDIAEISVKEDNSNCEEGEKDKSLEITNDVQPNIVPPKKKKKAKTTVKETDIIEAKLISEDTMKNAKHNNSKRKSKANNENNISSIDISLKENTNNCESGEKSKSVETNDNVEIDVVPSKKKKNTKHDPKEINVTEIENTIKNGEHKKKHKINDENESMNVIEIPQKKKKSILITELEHASKDIGNEIANSTPEVRNFSLDDEIMQILSKKEVILKTKLYSKVLKRYQKIKEEPITEEKISKKIDKRLKKCDKIVIQDDYIKLVK